MTFPGIWLQVYTSSVSSNSLPTYLRGTCSAPLFHSQNDLAKSFTAFVTDFAEIFWKKIEAGLKKLDFPNHIASHSFVRSQQFLHNILIDHCFVISQEVLSNPLRRQTLISFRLIQVFVELFVLHQFSYLGSYNYPFLDIYGTHIWEIIPQIIEITDSFIRTFDKVFMRTSFMCEGGRKIFSGRTIRGLKALFSHGVSEVLLGHSLFTQ